MAGTTQINPATGNTHRRKRMDVESFIALPDDGVRRELIEGEVVEMAPPTRVHQYVCQMLSFYLLGHVIERKLGMIYQSPIGMRASGISSVEPDIVFIPKGHADEFSTGRYLHQPELVIEILSPSTRDHDLLVKRLLYEKAGIQNYWIVDPEFETIEALSLVDGQYQPVAQKSDQTFCAPPFPHLEIETRKIFPPQA